MSRTKSNKTSSRVDKALIGVGTTISTCKKIKTWKGEI